MSVNEVDRRLAAYIEERLADTAEGVFDGADAAAVVMLRHDDQMEVGRGWLTAPDDHVAADTPSPRVSRPPGGHPPALRRF
jgi:hypothetical protein